MKSSPVSEDGKDWNKVVFAPMPLVCNGILRTWSDGVGSSCSAHGSLTEMPTTKMIRSFDNTSATANCARWLWHRFRTTLIIARFKIHAHDFCGCFIPALVRTDIIEERHLKQGQDKCAEGVHVSKLATCKKKTL